MTRLLAAAIALLVSGPAWAEDVGALADTALADLVSGKTVQGTMSDGGGAYKEFYDPDGTVRGRNADGLYEGKWNAIGPELCFYYDLATTPTCWVPVISQQNTIFWKRDGKVEGTGTLVAGNPNRF